MWALSNHLIQDLTILSYINCYGANSPKQPTNLDKISAFLNQKDYIWFDTVVCVHQRVLTGCWEPTKEWKNMDLCVKKTPLSSSSNLKRIRCTLKVFLQVKFKMTTKTAKHPQSGTLNNFSIKIYIFHSQRATSNIASYLSLCLLCYNIQKYFSLDLKRWVQFHSRCVWPLPSVIPLNWQCDSSLPPHRTFYL